MATADALGVRALEAFWRSFVLHRAWQGKEERERGKGEAPKPSPFEAQMEGALHTAADVLAAPDDKETFLAHVKSQREHFFEIVAREERAVESLWMRWTVEQQTKELLRTEHRGPAWVKKAHEALESNGLLVRKHHAQVMELRKQLSLKFAVPSLRFPVWGLCGNLHDLRLFRWQAAPLSPEPAPFFGDDMLRSWDVADRQYDVYLVHQLLSMRVKGKSSVDWMQHLHNTGILVERLEQRLGTQGWRRPPPRCIHELFPFANIAPFLD